MSNHHKVSQKSQSTSPQAHITNQQPDIGVEKELGLSPYRRGENPNSRANLNRRGNVNKYQTFRTIARVLAGKNVEGLRRYFQSPKRTAKERVVGRVLNQAINGHISSALLFERWVHEEDKYPTTSDGTPGAMAIIITDEIKRGLEQAGDDEAKLKLWLEIQDAQIALEKRIACVSSPIKEADE